MSDDLRVTLQARIQQFERQMARAQNTVERRFTAIEQRGRMMETRLAAMGQRAFAPVIAQAAAMVAPAAIARMAESVVSELSNMAKAADRVGLSTKNFQELQLGLRMAGIDARESTQAMDQFTDRIGEAATRGGRLAEIMEANGVAIRDANGNIRPTMDLLRDYAELIRRARSEQEAMVIATEAFGDRVGRRMALAWRDGAAAIDGYAKSAREAGGVIDEELLRKAEQLDDRWTKGWNSLEVRGKSALMTIISYMDRIANHPVFSQLGGLMAIANGETDVMSILFGRGTMNAVRDSGSEANQMAALERLLERQRAQLANIKELGFEAAETEAAIRATEAALSRLHQRMGPNAPGARPEGGPQRKPNDPPTVIPPGGGGGSGGNRNAAAEALLREAEAIDRLIDSMAHELSLIGLTEREKAKLNAVRAAGSAATPEQIQKIEALADALYEEAKAVEESRRAHEQRMETIESLFQMGAGALENIVSGSQSAEEAIKKLAVQLALAAAQAALLGSGPLSSIFGGGGLFRAAAGLGAAAAMPSAATSRFSAQATAELMRVPPSLSKSGLAGPAQALTGQRSPAQEININVTIDGARGNREIEEMVYSGVSKGIEGYDKIRKNLRRNGADFS